MFGVDDAIVAAAAPAVISAGASIFGASSANAASRKAVAQQEQFQEMMSNTSHQREVQDLIAAGLNPMLSAMHGGASTPSGGVPTIANPMAGVGDAVNSGLAGYTKQQELDNLRKNSDVMDSQISKNNADSMLSHNSAGVIKLRQDAISAQARADEAEANVKENLFKNHPDIMTAGDMVKNFFGPLSHSAESAVSILK